LGRRRRRLLQICNRHLTRSDGAVIKVVRYRR
jgi:hypothetical protein